MTFFTTFLAHLRESRIFAEVVRIKLAIENLCGFKLIVTFAFGAYDSLFYPMHENKGLRRKKRIPKDIDGYAVPNY